MKFKIDSQYQPSGDQPSAIKGICSALNQGVDAVTLLGVTGSGKTFTMANVIEKLQRPALILSHNKTLAAQLYGEFKSFFPNNAVEYFVSYYDYICLGNGPYHHRCHPPCLRFNPYEEHH